MPRGKPWPAELLADLAQSLMMNDGWTEERFNRLSERERQRIADRYLRKAKNILHDCYVLGLIEFTKSSGVG